MRHLQRNPCSDLRRLAPNLLKEPSRQLVWDPSKPHHRPSCSHEAVPDTAHATLQQDVSHTDETHRIHKHSHLYLNPGTSPGCKTNSSPHDCRRKAGMVHSQDYCPIYTQHAAYTPPLTHITTIFSFNCCLLDFALTGKDQTLTLRARVFAE